MHILLVFLRKLGKLKDLYCNPDSFLQIREDFRSALFNLALLLSEAGRPMEAIPFLHRLLQVDPYVSTKQRFI